MQELFKLIVMLADNDLTVLVQGESGVGKELVARAIHASGARAREPFVAINCAAIPEQLIESELFGHERGAFTDAKAARTGPLRGGRAGHAVPGRNLGIAAASAEQAVAGAAGTQLRAGGQPARRAVPGAPDLRVQP